MSPVVESVRPQAGLKSPVSAKSTQPEAISKLNDSEANLKNEATGDAFIATLESHAQKIEQLQQELETRLSQQDKNENQNDLTALSDNIIRIKKEMITTISAARLLTDNITPGTTIAMNPNKPHPVLALLLRISTNIDAFVRTSDEQLAKIARANSSSNRLTPDSTDPTTPDPSTTDTAATTAPPDALPPALTSAIPAPQQSPSPPPTLPPLQLEATLKKALAAQSRRHLKAITTLLATQAETTASKEASTLLATVDRLSSEIDRLRTMPVFVPPVFGDSSARESVSEEVGKGEPGSRETGKDAPMAAQRTAVHTITAKMPKTTHTSVVASLESVMNALDDLEAERRRHAQKMLVGCLKAVFIVCVCVQVCYYLLSRA